MKFLPLLLFLLFSTSCAKSLSYSPSITPAAKPLKPKEIHLQCSTELFPESRPEQDTYNELIPGITGNISIGLSNKVSARLKSWGDFRVGQAENRVGFSLSMFISKELNGQSRLIFIPSVGIVSSRFGSGWAYGHTLLYQKNVSDRTNFYGGLGFIRGRTDDSLDDVDLMEGQGRSPSGYAWTGNIGMGRQFTNSLFINLELNPIYQINTFNQVSNFVIAPSVSIRPCI